MSEPERREVAEDECARTGHELVVEHLGAVLCQCGRECDLVAQISPSGWLKKQDGRGAGSD